ncbi:MAG: YceI family protein [Nannocystaceae bacterium]|nr:YceI family protein [Nannocystaceae bacterium]
MNTKTILFVAFALCGAVSMSACDDGKKADTAVDKKTGDKKTDDKKTDDKKSGDKKAGEKDADAKKGDAGDKSADAKSVGDNSLAISVSHEPAKPDDPVTVTFTGLKVTKADFDPANLTGGTIQVEIDVTSLNSGSDKRDVHLKTAEYLDVATFATIKVDVSDIVKIGDGYTAKLVVDAHGQQVTWAATPFQVTASTDDSITVHLKKEFERTAFGVGKAEGDSVASKVSAELKMTIAKSG